MSDDTNVSWPDGVGVSLVDGDSGIRHARQLMLRSEHYDVRSYSTCAALLADPRSRDYPCIILDMDEVDGLSLLRKMRGSGWRGRALLLDGIAPDSDLLREADRHGDTVLERAVGDQTLLAAIASSINRGWSGWDVVG